MKKHFLSYKYLCGNDCNIFLAIFCTAITSHKTVYDHAKNAQICDNVIIIPRAKSIQYCIIIMVVANILEFLQQFYVKVVYLFL